jgi:hypothetical protein
MQRAGLDRSVFGYNEKQLPDIAKSAKGVIAISSSSCLYALACNIPVIVPRFPDRVDYNPLSYISDIPIYVYSASDLRSACDSIVSAAASPLAQQKSRRFLEEYLYFPKDEGEYLEKIISATK